MNVLVSVSARFVVTPDKKVWSVNPSLHYDFWARYLDVFDQVYLLARTEEREAPPSSALVSGPGLHLIPIPDFHGLAQYVAQLAVIRQRIHNALETSHAVILRVPCLLGSTVFRAILKNDDRSRMRRPVGLEVVGDPYDSFAPGSFSHPARPFLRSWFSKELRRQCREAAAVAYVTAQALQRRYPPAPTAFTTCYSNVELPDAAFASGPRRVEPGKKCFTLIFVGSLAQLYKAPDVLIDAVALCRARGWDIRLVMVGDGRHRPELEARAAARGLGDHVRFLGMLPAGEPVREQLDRADLFVLPSKVEGLPRAMLEAMARCLPCIGSTVGGIPELLPPDDLVPPGDAKALASKICEVLSDPERMECMSARNLQKAKEYREDILREKRISFYSYLRDRTEAWFQAGRERKWR